MIDFRTARPLPARYYSFLGVLRRRTRARSIRPTICRRGTKRSVEKARRNFLRLFNRPRRTFFEFSGHTRCRAESTAAAAAAAGWLVGTWPAPFRSFSFAASVKRAKTRRAGVTQPAILNGSTTVIVISCRENTLSPKYIYSQHSEKVTSFTLMLELSKSGILFRS